MPPPAKPPPRRRWRILRRIAIVLAILLVIGVAGFTWFAYWPFEGSVDRVESLVPAGVDFVVRGSWKDLQANGWVKRNVWEHPIHPGLDLKAGFQAENQAERVHVDQEVAKIDEQVNDQIPGAVKPLMGLVYGTQAFGVEKDVLGGDVVLAGTFCSRPGARTGPDFRLREWLALTRVTGPVKFALAATKHGFVRERIGPNVAVDEQPGGFLRIEMKNRLPTPSRYRTCEGAAEEPPENYVYVARVKDVLCVSNSDDLMARVVELANGTGASALDRQDFTLTPVEGGVAAAVDLIPARLWLNRLLGVEGGARGGKELSAFIGRFLTPNALGRMNATLEPRGEDALLGRAEITYSERDLSPAVKAVYALSPESFAEGIARMVPEADTFAVALMKAPPYELLSAVYESLGPAERRLIEDNVRGIGRRYKNVSEFLKELSQHVGTNTGVAFSRLSSIFDHVKYETWFSNDEPDPQPVLSVLLRIGIGHSKEQVDEFMSDRVQSLGFDKPVPVVRDGISYSRMEVKYRARDAELYKPAYLVTPTHLILTTNEEYLSRIMDAMAHKESSVADSAGFNACVSELPRNATLALYANGKILRDYLWDYRNHWVNVDYQPQLKKKLEDYRLARMAYYSGLSQRPNKALEQADLDKVNDEVDSYADQFRRDEYAGLVAQYRGMVDAWKRFRGGALVMAAHDGTIDGGMSLLLTPPEEAAR